MSRTGETTIWQPGWWMANIWLLFLLFPLISLLAVGDLSVWRKTIGVVLLALFAAAHAMGYRVMIRREMGLDERPGRAGFAGLIDPAGNRVWFIILIAIIAVGFPITSWPILGAVPFIVSYAVFNFSWPTAAITAVLCISIVVVAPLIDGELDELAFLAIVVASVGIATALARLTEERQHDVNALQTQLILSEERTRVARDVHDVLGHSLTAIVLKAQVAERALASIDPSPEVQLARKQIVETQTISRRALNEIRETVSGLRASDLGDEVSAARSVLADAGVTLTVHGDAGSVSEAHHAVLGWTVREAVTNIVRHANAERCTIEIGADPQLLRITDDGVGRSAGNAEGNGLNGLRERLAIAGLTLVIDDSHGTALNVMAPGATS